MSCACIRDYIIRLGQESRARAHDCRLCRASLPWVSALAHDLKPLGLSPHLFDHLATMARLHKENRYDRATSDVADLFGRPPSGFGSLVDETPALKDAATRSSLSSCRHQAATDRRV